MHTCTEFGVAGSKFTFTGGPHVKTASSPLARAAGTSLERYPQWILSWYSTRVTCEFGFSSCPRLTSRGARKFLVDLYAAARATCNVPPFRPATGTNVVPAFRCVHRCHPGPDRTSRSGAIPGNAWTHRQTDKHQPPNFFSPTHRRKSSFIRTCYALAPFILYDFGLEAGIAKHCLGIKIVDIAMIKSKSELTFRKRCLTRLHVRRCTMHTTACVIGHRITLMELDRCINFRVASSKYLEIRGPPACACVARAPAPQHPKSCTIE